jgi:uncharacterized OB-fold protein
VAIASKQRPIADDLFTWPSDDPRLIGGKCGECGVVTFPRQSGCPRCGAPDMAVTELSSRGTLWTFTTQEFEVKEPYRGTAADGSFEPFGLGYVELDENVKVETRLTERDPEKLQIGMDVQLVIVPAFKDSDGTEVLTFAFAPSADR